MAPSEKQSFRGHTLSAQLMHDPLKLGKKIRLGFGDVELQPCSDIPHGRRQSVDCHWGTLNVRLRPTASTGERKPDGD